MNIVKKIFAYDFDLNKKSLLLFIEILSKYGHIIQFFDIDLRRSNL